MNNYESSEYNSESASESIDLDAEYTEDYLLAHAEEFFDIEDSMKDEEMRRLEMEKDATLKATKIHEEVVFNNKGETYQKMIKNMRSSTDENEICQAFASGIFDMLGLEEDDRPVFILNKENDVEIINSNYCEAGHFEQPTSRIHHADSKARKNGIIQINLSSFNDSFGLHDVFANIEHECFHAYQFNSAMGRMPTRTMRDKIIHVAYFEGMIRLGQYASAKNDIKGYYEQGIESSARTFSDQLSRATDIIINDVVRTG
ncbi:hypothetical protein IKF94_01925 [Candidatus Saccharibacteria bacterium]|nr:hypothetical protein [Candidatus Saccharibacteria bacterium]